MGVDLDNPPKKFIISRATGALPQTAKAALFTVGGGRVRILEILGVVTTAIQNQANATKIVATPTVGSPVDLCAALDIANDAVGTNYSITGDPADTMQESTDGVINTNSTMEKRGIIVPAGTIDVECAASNTGAIQWTAEYEPIDAGAYVVPA